MAAAHNCPATMAFMLKHGSGIVYVGMKGEDLERLKLPLVTPEHEDYSMVPSFATTVDVIWAQTGVSAEDRSHTVNAHAVTSSKPELLRMPGHVFTLKYRNGGVLKRAGITEASVDLVMLAGCCSHPTSVLSAILRCKNDESMASLP